MNFSDGCAKLVENQYLSICKEFAKLPKTIASDSDVLGVSWKF